MSARTGVAPPPQPAARVMKNRILPLQLSLPSLPVPPPLDAGGQARVPVQAVERLHRDIADTLGRPIDLVPTDNVSSLLSWKDGPCGVLIVRVQRQYALSPEPVGLAIARLIRWDDPNARALLRQIAAGFVLPGRHRGGPAAQGPRGSHHDLSAHLQAQLRWHIRQPFEGRIGWSRRGARQSKGRASIRLGSWSPQQQLIRVHPVLDSARVPDFVVGFVVFHELLHAVLPSEQNGGRRRLHPPTFQAREARHPDHGRTQIWLARHLPELLRS